MWGIGLVVYVGNSSVVYVGNRASGLWGIGLVVYVGNMASGLCGE